MGSDYTLTLPTSAGSANQILQTNGSGLLSWVNSSSVPYLVDQTVNTVTGLTEQKVVSILIPANTFVAGNNFKVTMRLTRPASTGQSTYRFYINTSDAIGGSNIGIYQRASDASTSFLLSRSFNIINATSSTNYSSVAGTVGSSTDFANGVDTTIAVDWTVNQYFVISAQSSSGTGNNSSKAIIVSLI
jgi:hypothetical protein